MNNLEKNLREEVLKTVSKYYKEVFEKKKLWKVGDRIPYSGRIFDEEEMLNLVDSSLDFWLTSGRYCDLFEEKLENFLDINHCVLTNSGSSANLLAFMALTSPLLGERRVMKGDEVITVAAGFPTTIAPIIQYGAIPVFVDVELSTANININELNKALSPKTKAIMIAHTLGNPFNVQKVKEFCDENNLWLIEDNCDSLGAKAFINGQWKYTGTIGDIGTSSFYPPHHITMGEGGAVYTNNSLLNKIILSLRDWGRECYCKSGCDNTCNKRFNLQRGQLPFGYDHKYVYSHLGYNLKATEMQAAIGCAQIDKLNEFIEKRNYNFKRLKEGLQCLEEYLILPQVSKECQLSAFGFLVTLKDENQSRKELVEYLESNGIQTRLLFAGNIIKQPAFDLIREDKTLYRVIGELENTNKIMNSSFFVGVYPGINDEMLEFMINTFKEYFKRGM